jgi:hypothetical protein
MFGAMRRSVRRLVALATCARSFVGMTSFVAAMTSSASALASAEEADRVVFVLHDGSPEAGVLRTFDRMQAQLGELELDISAVYAPRVDSLQSQAQRAAKIAAAEHAKAVFWFAEGVHGVLRVYALHALSGRVFARDVVLRGDTTAQREQLSVVLRAAIPAVLDGALDMGKPLLVVPPDAMARPSANPEGESSPGATDVDAAAEDAERSEPWRVTLALGYIGSSIAEDFEWQSGVAGDVIFRVPRAFRVSAGAGYAAKSTIRGVGADANISRVPVVGRLGVERALGPGTLTLEAGVLLDVWQRRTSIRSAALVPTAPSTTLLWGGVLGVRVEAPIVSRVGLFLSLEAHWMPSEHALIVSSPQGEEQEQTRSLRPQIGTGLLFDLVSGEEYRGQAE